MTAPPFLDINPTADAIAATLHTAADLTLTWGADPEGAIRAAAYGRIAQACTQCGAVDLAVRWPCPTIQAVDAEQPAGEVSR